MPLFKLLLPCLFIIISVTAQRSTTSVSFLTAEITTTQELHIRSAQAQPKPKEDFYGYSLTGYYNISSTGEPLGSNWSSPSSDLLLPLPPTFLHASSPYRSSLVKGYCTIPAPTKGWPDDDNLIGAHVWIANLAYNEQIAWPHDLFITTAYNQSFDGATRNYSFSIPLYSFLENLDHFLNSGVPVCGGGSGSISCPTLTEEPSVTPHTSTYGAFASQYITGDNNHGAYKVFSSYSTSAPDMDPIPYDYSTQRVISNQYYLNSPKMAQGSASPGQGITQHSWASFSAGHFFVLCNTFSINPFNGLMTPSVYIPHEPFNFDPTKPYISPFINESRFGISAVFSKPEMPNGFWGNTPISNYSSLTAESCWREAFVDTVSTTKRSEAPCFFSGEPNAGNMCGAASLVLRTSSLLSFAFYLAPASPLGLRTMNLDGTVGGFFSRGPGFVNGSDYPVPITIFDRGQQVRIDPVLYGHTPLHRPPKYQGMSFCYFGLPYTWGREPTKLTVTLDGEGRSGATVSARYDGPLHRSLASSYFEFYWLDAGLSFIHLLTNHSPGDILTQRLTDLPIGIRQTILARISVNDITNNLQFPEGLFSPWAPVTFRVPQISNFPPTLAFPTEPGWCLSTPFVIISSNLTVNGIISEKSVLAAVSRGVTDKETPQNLTFSLILLQPITYMSHVYVVSVAVTDCVLHPYDFKYEGPKTASFLFYVFFVASPISTSLSMPPNEPDLITAYQAAPYSDTLSFRIAVIGLSFSCFCLFLELYRFYRFSQRTTVLSPPIEAVGSSEVTALALRQCDNTPF